MLWARSNAEQKFYAYAFKNKGYQSQGFTEQKSFPILCQQGPTGRAGHHEQHQILLAMKKIFIFSIVLFSVAGFKASRS
jgi:hypothetical protein